MAYKIETVEGNIVTKKARNTTEDVEEETKKMGYNREAVIGITARGITVKTDVNMGEILEETIKKLALDIQGHIESSYTVTRSEEVSIKTNALANLVRAFVEVPNGSKEVVNGSSIEATASEVRFSLLEKKIADLERDAQSQQEKMERYGINLR